MPAPQLTLFLPGLIWPNASARGLTQEITLPALETILGRATRTPLPTAPDDAALATRFGLADTPGAALRRRGEDHPVPPHIDHGHILCADPVHLNFAREVILLDDPAGLQLTAEEAEALVTALNAHLATYEIPELILEAPAPDRWYLHLPEAPALHLTPLADAIGRSVPPYLPHGEDAPKWAALTNELQILLHQHPINLARQQRGLPTINSLWLWGRAPVRTAAATPPAPRILADEPLARGLARAAGVEPDLPRTLSDNFPLSGDTFACLSALRAPALRLDLAEWQRRLAALDRDWLAPALHALTHGQLRRLRLEAPGERLAFACTLTPAAARWKFWARPLPLDTTTGIAPAL